MPFEICSIDRDERYHVHGTYPDWQTCESAYSSLVQAGLRERCWYRWLDTSGSRTTLETIRQKTGMFIGETTERGALQAILEVVSNSVDQILQGLAKDVRVKVDGRTFEVMDDGAGWSRERAKCHLSSPHVTPTADGHAPHIHLSSTGVGLCPINALSAELEVESFDRDGGWRLRYERGELQSEESIDRTSGSATRVKLDPEIFRGCVPLARVRRTLFDAVHLFPGLRIFLNEEVFFAPGGLVELAAFEAAHREMSAHFQDDEQQFGAVVDGPELSLSFAAVGETNGVRRRVTSWVNGGLTPGDGTHVDGAKDALRRVGWKPAALLLHVIMKNPRWAGPCKDKLAVKETRRLVREALRDPLARHVEMLNAEAEISRISRRVDRPEILPGGNFGNCVGPRARSERDVLHPVDHLDVKAVALPPI